MTVKLLTIVHVFEILKYWRIDKDNWRFFIEMFINMMKSLCDIFHINQTKF